MELSQYVPKEEWTKEKKGDLNRVITLWKTHDEL